MSYTIEGNVIKIGETQTFGSGFQKRQFVIETKEKYPQKIPFDVIKERCDQLDSWKVGEHMKVFFNVRGNEWKEKYYVNLEAWQLRRDEADQRPRPPAGSDYDTPAPEPQKPSAFLKGAEDGDDSDIPF